MLRRTRHAPESRHARRLSCSAAALAAMAMSCCAAEAVAGELIEQTIRIPVRMDWTPTPQKSVPLFVTLTYQAGTRHRPFVLLLHGRPTTPEAFARMGILSYPANARWLVEQGFAVLTPTRIGYGQTGGPDVEFAGNCDAKDYRRPLLAMHSEVRQLLGFARHWPAVDVRHGLVLGESFGALGALALGNGSQPGVLGVVNVAGGDGGDFTQPDHPCASDAVSRAFGGLGASARLPSLWLYSRNDHLWGNLLPRQWFASYQQAGGQGRFVELEDVPGNGHFMFNRRPLTWHAPLLEFARSVGVGGRVTR